jgi:2-dehydro-3-deoxygluconokinase
MGLYFLEYGAAPRPVRVLYDRRDSAASRLVPGDVDWALVRRARLLHVTGVTAALGPNLRDVVRRALEEAAAAGVRVSFDVNYRSRLWSPKEAREFLDEILPRLDYLFIGADDAATLYDLTGAPDDVLATLRPLAPRATIALTLGEAGSAVLDGPVIVRPSRRYAVTEVDRLGAGDAYAAGLLWATLSGRALQDAVDAGTALAALKCTIWGDVPVVTREELDEILASDSTEIRR